MKYMSNTDIAKKNKLIALMRTTNVVNSKFDTSAKGKYVRKPIGGYPT